MALKITEIIIGVSPFFAIEQITLGEDELIVSGKTQIPIKPKE